MNLETADLVPTKNVKKCPPALVKWPFLTQKNRRDHGTKQAILVDMRCEDCPRFDADKGVCKDRKLNPESFPAAVEVVQIFGPRAICTLNDYREQMLDI